MRDALGRLGAALRNGLEIAWLGGLGAGSPAPFDVVHRSPVFALRRFFPDHEGERPALVLVPPLMLTAEVYDVGPDASAVSMLAALGVDPWVVDFGAPERVEGGLSRTLADHVLAVSAAVDRAREITGRDVHLGGYSQGGMFCYQAAAFRRGEGLASIVTFGSPVDVHRALPAGIPEEVAAAIVGGAGALLAPLFSRAWVPAWASRIGFRLLDPAKDVQQRIQFLAGLYDRETILKRESQRRFLASEGFVAYPGPALRDFLDEFFVHNRLLSGGLVVDGRTVTLADVDRPILAFVGETDEIARPAAVRAIERAAPRSDVYEVAMRAGHFGLVVGSKAAAITWPAVAAWVLWREGLGARPALVREIGAPDVDEAPSSAVVEEVRERADLLWRIGRSTARTIAARALDLRKLAEDVLPQIPRIARLGSLRRDTRISLGLLLDEAARHDPEATLFLFEGRAHGTAAANRRVEAVVRGLLASGVRHGSAVGVLMRTRPSALALVAALSRIGAVAVLLRPDGDLEQETRLGGVEILVAEPESAALGQERFSGAVLVLGGGGPDRPVAAGVVDLEAIDPDAVDLPAWYEPNPGRAEDVAIVLFSGRGAATHVNRITNRRFAVSAFGTASAAALSPRDTVYCATPLHHPTGLLVCVGGALVAGSRLAMGTRFEPKTFWEEVRRYGVSVVFYTGTMLATLVNAPRDRGERHHPLRLFAGSGMPRALWRRVVLRFAPAQVLEFWASTEGGAVLANLTGEKIGAVGRPLPGTAEVALVGWDFEANALALGPDGFARRVASEETGVLLVRVERERGAVEQPALRGVFEKGDAWLSSGEIFRRDEDGDHWRLDSLADLVRGPAGPVFAVPIEDALGEIDAVDLAVVYGDRVGRSRKIVPIAALELRGDRELDLTEIFRASARFPLDRRPRFVRIVDRVPLTAGHRPIKAALRGEPIDPARTFALDRETGDYAPLAASGARSRRGEAR